MYPFPTFELIIAMLFKVEYRADESLPEGINGIVSYVNPFEEDSI